MVKKFVLKIGLFFCIFLLIPIVFSKSVTARGELSEKQIGELVNRERKQQGLTELKVEEKLTVAAADKARDMFEEQYWSHNSPEGLTPWYFIKKSGYKYRYAGENLAKGFATEEDLVQAWMNSEFHRKNILNYKYTDMGIASVSGELFGKETVITVMMMGKGEKIMEIRGYWEKIRSLYQKRPNWLAVAVD